MKKFLLLLSFYFVGIPLQAQAIIGIESKWIDSFVEWSFFTEEEDQVGYLQLRWIQQEDWSEWEYRIDERFGQIKQKWKGNLNEWELRGNNQIITMRTLWQNDFREWRITNNKESITFKSKYGNQLDEWEVRNDNHGYFAVYTEYEGRPNSWLFVDEMDEEISFEMKLAMVFISIFHGTPKQ